MKNVSLKFAAFFVLGMIFCASANAQQNETKKHKALRITGKVTVFVGRSTAKLVYETAKFTGKYVIVPAFKSVAVPLAKATPPLAVKAVKLTAKGVTNGLKAISRDKDDEQASSNSN